MIDFNHGALKSKAAVPDTAMLDAAAQKLAATQPRRPYLGGSRLGEPCARKLQYEYLGRPDSPRKASTHNIFAIGHAGEDAVAQLLKAAGLDLRTHDRSGSQFGFSVAGDRIRGHIDGVVCGGPATLGPYPFLWENKWVAAKYWNAIVKKGVAAERPVYAGQVSIYQAYMGLEENPALFSVGNRDTGEVAFERLPFDARRAQEASDRGVSILTACEAGEWLPRAYASSTFYECKWCPHSAECWA